MRWLDGITSSTDMSLSQLQEIVGEEQGSLACCSPWGHKESDTTQCLNNIISSLLDPPEKEMATYSSIRAWEIPWMEEPGRLQSMFAKESDTTQQLNGSKLWRPRLSRTLTTSCSTFTVFCSFTLSYFRSSKFSQHKLLQKSCRNTKLDEIS